MKTKRQKTGGRKPGTPNRVTAETKQFLQAVFNENKHYLEKAFEDNWSTNDDKLELLFKILPYIAAKPVEVSIESEYRRLAMLLEQTPEAYIEAVSQKVLELHEKSKEVNNE